LTAALAVLSLVSAMAGPAGAQSSRPNQVGAAALELIDYPWRDLGWTVDFLPGRTGYLGLAIGEERRLEIYVRDHHTVFDIAHTFAHELGHAVDLTYGTEYRRSEYQRMRGLPQRDGWFGCDACTDYATPAGDFAEVFEYWLLGGGDYRSQLASPPSSEQLVVISTLFQEPFEPSVRVFWRQRWRPARPGQAR
jgi:hypothetical protein